MPRIFTALDIGSSTVRVLVAQINAGERPQILGTGVAQTQGMRRGVVADIEDVAKSIEAAVRAAQAISGITVTSVFVGVNGVHLQAQESRGVIAVARADKEITEADVTRAVHAAEMVNLPPNREIIEVIARTFNIDDERGIKNPVGMNGIRLEVNGLLIVGSTPFLRNLTKAIEKAKLDIRDLIPGPMAAAEPVLTKRQKELGVMALDIGAETTGLAVFEEGEITQVQILPIGSAHITNDLAIGLRTDLDTAEKIKIRYGTCLPDAVRKNETIDLSELGMGEAIHVRRQEVAEIIGCRMKEILELANQELEKINRKGFLPAGAVLVGGGAKMPGLVELGRQVLMLPVKVGYPSELQGLVDQVADPGFAKVVGLITYPSVSGKESAQGGGENIGFGKMKRKVAKLFKSMLP